MKRKAMHAAAAFAVGAILILACAGFLAVDLSADRDMPGEYQPILRFSDIDRHGMTVALFGRIYTFLPEQLEGVKEALWKARALLPAGVRAAGFLFTRGWGAVAGW